MYSDSEFYVVLPSNVENISGSGFKNKPHHYRTVLPQPYEVDSPYNWEVALEGINYPQNFNTTIKLKKCVYSFASRKNNDRFKKWLVERENELLYNTPEMPERKKQVAEVRYTRKRYDKETKIHSNCTRNEKQDAETEMTNFDSIENLILWLNETKPQKMKGRFGLTDDDPKLPKVFVTLKRNEIIRMDPLLASVLGFENTTVQGKDGYMLNRRPEKRKIVDEEEDDETKDTPIESSDEEHAKHISDGKMESHEDGIDVDGEDHDGADEDDDDDDSDEEAETAISTRVVPEAVVESPFEKKLRLLLNDFLRKNRSRKRLVKVVANKLSDLRMSAYNIFVYSNLVRSTLVGSSEVPLLRTIPILQEQEGKNVGLAFDRLRYRPLASNFFSFIDIRLCDDMGDDLDFKAGKVVVTLNIRRRKQQNFGNCCCQRHKWGEEVKMH